MGYLNKVSRVLVILISSLMMLLSIYYIYQLIDAAKENSSYGITTSAVVIGMLILIGIIGLIAAVRKSKSISISFVVTCVIVAVMCAAELIVTLVYAEDEEKCSDDLGAIADFVCGMGSEVKLLVPLGVATFMGVVGLISGILFVASLGDDDYTDEKGKELDNYYS